MAFRKARPQVFRPVVGWDGIYEVGDRGDVRRVKTASGARAGRLLDGYRTRDGYRNVLLKDSTSGRAASRPVHQLVAEAFIGPKNPGYQVNHRNFDKSDNWIENLEYVTAAENSRHAAAAGRRRGENNANAKLTAEQVLEIRRLYSAGGTTQAELGKLFGVSQVQISHVVRQTVGGWNAVQYGVS